MESRPKKLLDQVRDVHLSQALRPQHRTSVCLLDQKIFPLP
jgi:hypothetical protein